jgi:hypothetical protein
VEHADVERPLFISLVYERLDVLLSNDSFIYVHISYQLQMVFRKRSFTKYFNIFLTKSRKINYSYYNNITTSTELKTCRAIVLTDSDRTFTTGKFY